MVLQKRDRKKFRTNPGCLDLIQKRTEFRHSLLPVIQLRSWANIIRFFPHLFAFSKYLTNENSTSSPSTIVYRKITWSICLHQPVKTSSNFSTRSRLDEAACRKSCGPFSSSRLYPMSTSSSSNRSDMWTRAIDNVVTNFSIDSMKSST